MGRKLKKTLLAIIPATLGLAVCAGLATNQVITKEDVETRAITPAANQSLYLEANASFWDSASAKYAVYAFNTSTNRWSGFMSKATADTDISGLYKVTMDLTDMTGIIFVRMNTTATTPGWDTKWNQSENLTIADAGENDIYKITAWGGTTSPGEWHKSSALSSTNVTINVNISTDLLSGGTPYAYAYGDYIKSAMAWPGVAMTSLGDSLYSIAVSETYSKLIINNNSGRQTVDLSIDDFIRKQPTNYGVIFKISSYDSGTTKYVGTWDQSGTVTNVFPKFSSSYMRLWLNRNGVGHDTGSNFYTVHFWDSGSGTNYEIMPRGYNNFSNGGNWWFAYYDVPVAYIGYNMQFKEYLNSTGAFQNVATSNSVTYTDGDNAKIYKLTNTSGVYSLSRDVIGATANDVPATAYKTVFEGYFSCSSDKNNGYGNYGQFSQTWIKNGETVYVVDGINGLATASINDFASKATEDYTTGDNRIHTTTLYDKYIQMAILYNTIADAGDDILLVNHNEPLINNTNFSSTEYTVIIVIAVIGISSVLAYAFLFAKKHRKNV